MDTLQPQQEFLRDAMRRLGMSRNQFAERIGASRRALDKWLLPDDSKDFRPLDNIARKFVEEILKHEENESITRHLR